MRKMTFTKELVVVIVMVLMTSLCYGQFTVRDNSKLLRSSGYAPVNGIKLYYEVYGDGQPVVLLHGSFMNIDMNWGEMIPELSKKKKIIAVEMQGHGRTADRPAEFTYPTLANDIAGLMKHLKIDSADVIGYSLGGTVAFQLAINHPQLVKKLVIISSVFKLDGWLKQARDIFPTITPEMFENTVLKSEYDRLAPDKSNWSKFVKKIARFDSIPFNLGAGNIKAIQSPVLLISGDNDGVDLDHIAEMYRLLGGGVFGDMQGLPKSQLAIIPGMTHVTLMMQTQKLVSIIDPFLNQTESKTVQH